MVIGALYFVALIKQGGVEDKGNVLLNQPCDMPVRQFRGVAFRLAGNGFDAKLVNFSVGGRGKYHLIAQLGKEGEPEGVIFIHIEHSWNAHLPAHCLIRRERLIGEETF